MIEETRIFGYKMKYEKPPVYESVCAAFQINAMHAIFTYGDTIYNPSALKLPEHIIQHESVHMEQQGWTNEGAALWWGKFLRDPEFRIDQESEAYAYQYAFICSQTKDRNERVKFLDRLAGSLAGPLYNHCITKTEAMKLIKSRSGMQ